MPTGWCWYVPINTDVDEGDLPSARTTACPSVSGLGVSSWVTCFPWWHRSGEQTEEIPSQLAR